MLNEQRVLKELLRRKLPFQHRIHIGNYEVDFLVGKRILVEVDGYVHVTKNKISKDTQKEELLSALGYTILRITGIEARNKGLLREFGAKVQALYQQDLARSRSYLYEPLKHPVPQEKLQRLNEKLKKEADDRKKFPKGKSHQDKKSIKKELTDEELFKQAVARLQKQRRK